MGTYGLVDAADAAPIAGGIGGSEPPTTALLVPAPPDD